MPLWVLYTRALGNVTAVGFSSGMSTRGTTDLRDYCGEEREMRIQNGWNIHLWEVIKCERVGSGFGEKGAL